jgi:hypothetical protein
MKIITQLFHFLGSIYCAILLICIAAIFVIVGTILEASTESHLYAASFTYGNPSFFLLLSLFFINILFSALRRWPFQKHHIPFLLTHLGLLMVIAGVMIKNIWGIQGTMGILEGASSNRIFIPGSYAIHLEKRNLENYNKPIVQEWPLQTNFSGRLKNRIKKKGEVDLFPEVAISILNFEPNGKEILDTWVKDDFAVIEGLPPLPIYDGNSFLNFDSPLPISSYMTIDTDLGKTLFEVMVFQTDSVSDLAKRVYQDKKPRILIIQDNQGDIFFFAFDNRGLIAHEEYLTENLLNIVSYDRGFGGYSVQAQLPQATIESPITFRHQSIPITNKWENHKPLIGLKFQKQGQSEKMILAYDPYGIGLKRPVLNGEYVVRFQPTFLAIPYSLRIRNARQINYPNDQQASSYECDLIITNRRNDQSSEITLSMNHVHETWDGFRFYLANISPQNESAPKRVQIVVNRDPVKYIMTYPGGFFIAVGIVMLFWLAPYRQIT